MTSYGGTQSVAKRRERLKGTFSTKNSQDFIYVGKKFLVICEVCVSTAPPGGRGGIAPVASLVKMREIWLVQTDRSCPT